MADSKLQPLLDAAAKAKLSRKLIKLVRIASEPPATRTTGYEIGIAAIDAATDLQRLVSLELRLRDYVDRLKKYGSDFTPMELSSPGVEARMSFAAAQIKQLEEILETRP